jgi:hypothetical protein
VQIAQGSRDVLRFPEVMGIKDSPENRHREQQSVCDRKVVCGKTDSQIEKGTLVFSSHIRKIS